jgi:hypothetical protein
MHFRVTSEHTYWWPVTVSMPDPERPGKYQEFEFHALFRALPRKEANELNARTALAETSNGLEAETIRAVLKGWDDGVVGEDKAPVPFGTEALDVCMELPWFRRGVLNAYAASVLQGGGPKAGN